MERSNSVPDPGRRSLEIRGLRVGILKTACVAVVLYWMAIGVFSLSLVMYLIPSIDRSVLNRWSFGVFLAFLVINVIGLITGSQVRCPKCSKLVLLNSWVAPHPDAHRTRLLGYKALVLDILRRNEFICYHCGEEVRIA